MESRLNRLRYWRITTCILGQADRRTHAELHVLPDWSLRQKLCISSLATGQDAATYGSPLSLQRNRQRSRSKDKDLPPIFDNIEKPLLPALEETFESDVPRRNQFICFHATVWQLMLKVHLIA